MAVNSTNNDKLYAVWEEDNRFNAGTIFYAEGTVEGNTVSWTEGITVSPILDFGPPLGALDNFTGPEIVILGNTRHVAYTASFTTTIGAPQTVHYVRCSSNCASESGWSDPVDIAGAFVGANASSPVVVRSSLVSYRNSLFNYFHGTADPLGGEDKEIIWGVNKYDGWSAGGREEVTIADGPDGIRALHPMATTQGFEWIYIVYEAIDEQDSQVEFRRSYNEAPFPGVFLPAIFRR